MVIVKEITYITIYNFINDSSSHHISVATGRRVNNTWIKISFLF